MEEDHTLSNHEIYAAIERCDFEFLSALYTDAANACEQLGNIDEACFFLTQAYVYALQQGADNATTLHARLIAHGRES